MAITINVKNPIIEMGICWPMLFVADTSNFPSTLGIFNQTSSILDLSRPSLAYRFLFYYLSQTFRESVLKGKTGLNCRSMMPHNFG